MALSGAVSFVAFGPSADLFLVTAKAGSEAILCLVPRDAAGLAIATTPNVDGSTSSTLTFSRVAVADDEIVAKGGLAAATAARMQELIVLGTSAELLGVAEAALDVTVQYTRLREQFGRKIGSFQALQHRMVDCYVDAELNRSLLFKVLSAWDAGTCHPAMVSAVKARVGKGALKTVRTALQLHGAIGYTDEHDIGVYYKRAVALAAKYGNEITHVGRFSGLTLRSAPRSELSGHAAHIGLAARRRHADVQPAGPRQQLRCRDARRAGRRLRAFGRDAAVRVIVLRGAGKHFSAGAAIGEGGRPRRLTAEICAMIDAIPKPTVAVAQGACIGGALAIASSCDVVIASRDAFFAIPEVRLGFAPGPLLGAFARGIGFRALRRYLLSGERFSAEEGHRLGLVHRLCDAGAGRRRRRADRGAPARGAQRGGDREGPAAPARAARIVGRRAARAAAPRSRPRRTRPRPPKAAPPSRTSASRAGIRRGDLRHTARAPLPLLGGEGRGEGGAIRKLRARGETPHPFAP